MFKTAIRFIVYDKPKSIIPDNKLLSDTLNDIYSIKQQYRKSSNVGDDTNPMASRWSSIMDVHTKNSVGSPEYTNIDKTTRSFRHSTRCSGSSAGSNINKIYAKILIFILNFIKK